MGPPALSRLVDAPSLTVPTAAVARVLGAVHVAAPLLTLLWFVFPQASGVRVWPLVGFLLAGMVLGLALLGGFGDAWPRSSLTVVLAVATLLVTVAVLLVARRTASSCSATCGRHRSRSASCPSRARSRRSDGSPPP